MTTSNEIIEKKCKECGFVMGEGFDETEDICCDCKNFEEKRLDGLSKFIKKINRII